MLSSCFSHNTVVDYASSYTIALVYACFHRAQKCSGDPVLRFTAEEGKFECSVFEEGFHFIFAVL